MHNMLDTFAKECQDKALDHVSLMEFIRKSCNGQEIEIAQLVISSDELDEKIKFFVLVLCFNSSQAKSIVINAISTKLLSPAVSEMIVSAVSHLLNKNDFLDVFNSLKCKGIKMKMIKKLFKNPNSSEIADGLISLENLNEDYLIEAAKFASTKVFIDTLSNCDRTSIPWRDLSYFCTDNLLKYFESEFLKLHWNEYSSLWTVINSNLPSRQLFKSEYLIGLLKLFERFPSYIYNSSKEFSNSSAPDFSKNLDLKIYSQIFLKERPIGDYWIVVDHLKSIAKTLNRPFHNYFIENLQNAFFNWNLKPVQKQELIVAMVDSLGYDFSILSIDLDKVSNEKLACESWKTIFINILKNPKNLNIQCAELILAKIENLMKGSTEKMDGFKSIGDKALRELFEKVYLKNVISSNLSLYISFSKSLLENLGAKFSNLIKKIPQKSVKMLELLNISENIMTLMNSYFKNLSSNYKEHDNGIQEDLISIQKGISDLRNFIVSKVFLKNFNFPLLCFENQIAPEFFSSDASVEQFTAKVHSEFISKDFFSDWIESWYPLFMSYLEKSLSLSCIPEHAEVEVFDMFSSSLEGICTSLPNEKFYSIVIKPSFELLDKLAQFEFVPTKCQRYCHYGMSNIKCIELLLKSAVPRCIFHNEFLDKFFGANMILFMIKENCNNMGGHLVEKAKFDTVVKSLELIFQYYADHVEKNNLSTAMPNFKQPDYSSLFSASLLKNIAKKFKFLLCTNHNGREEAMFSAALDKMQGFSNVLCRAIVEEFSEAELTEIVEKSIRTTNSTFEKLFLFNLPIESSVVKLFFAKNIARFDNLESKLTFYDGFYNAAFRQICKNSSGASDGLLAASLFIEPKIANVNWNAKRLEHPLKPEYIMKAYLSPCSPEDNTSVEHTERVIAHLKEIWDHQWKSDPHSYYGKVEKFVAVIGRAANKLLFTKMNLRLLSENVHDLVLKPPGVRTYELWSDFCYNLQFRGLVLSKGTEVAQKAMILPPPFEFLNCIERIRNDQNERKVSVAALKWCEERAFKLIEEYYSVSGTGTMVYNASIHASILEISARFEFFSPRAEEAFERIAQFCRSSLNDLISPQILQLNSELFLSLSGVTSLNICPSIIDHDATATKKWDELSLPTRKAQPHLFDLPADSLSGCVRFLQKFVAFFEELGHCFVALSFPVSKYYIAKHLLWQFIEPEMDSSKFKLEFYKSAIRICPSFLRFTSCAALALMENDPMALLAVLNASDSRLLKGGTFASNEISSFSIPFTTGRLSKNIRTNEKEALQNYFISHVLDRPLALNDRVNACKWLVNCFLSLTEIFPGLFSKLSDGADDPARNKLLSLLTWKLYNAPAHEMALALEISFSDLIFANSEVIETVLSGLASKRIGDQFYSLILPYIGSHEKLVALASKLNFAGQRALAQLVSTLDNGNHLIEFLNVENANICAVFGSINESSNELTFDSSNTNKSSNEVTSDSSNTNKSSNELTSDTSNTNKSSNEVTSDSSNTNKSSNELTSDTSSMETSIGTGKRNLNHFKLAVLSNLIQLLAESHSESEITERILQSIRKTIEHAPSNPQNVMMLKKVLEVELSAGLVKVQHASSYVPYPTHGCVQFKNPQVALKYSQIVLSVFLERSESSVVALDQSLRDAFLVFLQNWGRIENFISEQLIVSLIKVVDSLSLDDQDKQGNSGFVQQCYLLFPQYAAFLAKLPKSSIDPYSYLYAHFKDLLARYEAHEPKTPNFSILKKLNFIAEMNKSGAKFNLASFSTTKNIKEAAVQYQLANNLYTLLSKRK
jgi:hypothetical protein